jgi:hypothetical protein
MDDPELESYIREKQEQRRRMEQPARKISDPERDKPRGDPRLAAERRRRRNPLEAERPGSASGSKHTPGEKGFPG